jgi:hypothetical protein
MKSKKEIEMENERELLRMKDSKDLEILRIKDSKDLEIEKIHTMKEIEDKKMNFTIEIESMKIANSEKERRLKSVLAIVYVIAIFILGTQLRDGLLGRVTTFNSIVNELKEGILKLTKAVQVLVGGIIFEVVLNNSTRARSFLCKIFRR